MRCLRFAVTLPLIAATLQSCSGPASRSDISANLFLGLESRLAELKSSWIEADFRLLSATCSRIKPEIRVRLSRQGNTAGVDDYDDRKRICESVAERRSSLASLKRQAADATSGDAFEDVQRLLEGMRTQADAVIQEVPTSSFVESNFPPAAASAYRAKHEATAQGAGKLAAEAVAAARDASGAAMAQARTNDHELDKARARLADEGYTRATAELQQLSSTTNASEILAIVTILFREVDGAIGSAQGTGRVGGNPVDVAHEAVPAAEPTKFATPAPTPTVLLQSSGDAATSGTARSTLPCTTHISDPRPPANVRDAPDGSVVAKLQNDAAATVDDERGDWLHLSAPTSGWIHKSVTSGTCDPATMHEWPAGHSAYTVILTSTSSRTEADAKVRAFRDTDLSVGTLHSDDFGSLRPGYWVVFSGVYGSLEAAQGAAKAARSRVPDAYAKHVIPR